MAIINGESLGTTLVEVRAALKTDKPRHAVGRRALEIQRSPLYLHEAEMKSSEIRQKFLEFFESHGHTVVPSSPLVPGNDPTLLFTNAGMVQFKDVFLGHDKRPYTAGGELTALRACRRQAQRSGKRWLYRAPSYLFRNAGQFQLRRLFQAPCHQIRVGISYGDAEHTARKNYGSPYMPRTTKRRISGSTRLASTPARFTRIATLDNFWQMGDTGPCGPCSEIFYDHGAEIPGGPPGTPEADGDRYVEIWNLVFMQYNRDSAGTLHPLPRPSVDTGMGLERISAVMQQVHSNYEIDLFQDLIRAAAHATGTTDLSSSSLRVIADHIRACSFLITDGVIPGNEGRGYVLRRIIRRAIRHGYKLGQKEPFFHLLVEDLAKVMGQAYPELVEAKTRVAAVLKQEEERFAETLENGMEVLEGGVAAGRPACWMAKRFSGCTIPSAFRLISPRILRGSAASQWTRPVSSGQWSASASAPGQQASSQWRKALHTAARRRLFTATKTCGRKGRFCPLSGKEAGSISSKRGMKRSWCLIRRRFMPNRAGR